jgi:hypothetical protein
MKNFCTAGLLLLCGCSADYLTEYENLNCEQLNKEYEAILAEREKSFNERMQMNEGMIVLGAIAGVISKQGNTELIRNSFGEEDSEARLSALRKTMMKNKCNEKIESGKGDGK